MHYMCYTLRNLLHQSYKLSRDDMVAQIVTALLKFLGVVKDAKAYGGCLYCSFQHSFIASFMMMIHEHAHREIFSKSY